MARSPRQPAACGERPSSRRGKLTLVPPASSWHFLAVAEIANFAALRRHVGRSRADRLFKDVIARLRPIFPDARIEAAGRNLLEIEQLGDAVADLAAALGRIADAFATPLVLDGEHHRVELLLAAAAAQVGAVEDVRLAEEAEEALAQARAEHRCIIRDLSRGSKGCARAALRRELPHAIARGEMFMQYQPKVHVRKRQVASAEALVRWDHPTRGLILPGDFIALAEEMQLIGRLTLWTLDRVIADQRLIAGDGHDLTIFINISGQLLADAAFVDEACAMVRDSGARIGFEITETSMIRDPETAIANLQRIAAGGVPIAIDDYGAGLSSLAYLKQLPASELKIDKMFVMELTSSNRDPLIVRSTIDLAHAMEMEVTAEGVETPAALALLSVMGCDMVQGYLISRPVSIDAFRHFLDEQDSATPAVGTASLFRPASFWKSA